MPDKHDLRCPLQCFVTEIHTFICNPYHFPEMLIYDKLFKKVSDLNNNKILSYFHKSAKFDH